MIVYSIRYDRKASVIYYVLCVYYVTIQAKELEDQIDNNFVCIFYDKY